jgi:hypothetical protein
LGAVSGPIVAADMPKQGLAWQAARGNFRCNEKNIFSGNDDRSD